MTRIHAIHPDAYAGFTLAEVLVALFFFTILGMGMLEISDQVYYRDALRRETRAATELANIQVEEFLGVSFNDPSLSDPDGAHDVDLEALGSIERFYNPDHVDSRNPLDAGGGKTGHRKFKRVWNVGTDFPIPGMKTVTVLVGWTDPRGHAQLVTQTVQVARLE